MGKEQNKELVKYLATIRAATLKAAEALGRKSLFNSLVITTIDVATAIDNASAFYAKKKRIDLNESPALLMKSDKGVIRMWERAVGNPKALAESIGDISRIDDLDIVNSALDIILYDVLNDDCPPYSVTVDNERSLTWTIKSMMKSDSGEDDLKFASEMFDSIAISLKVRHIALELKEHEAYDANPKWKHIGYEYEPDGPFDCTEARRNCSVELHKFFEQYGNPLQQLVSLSKLLKRVDRTYPLAFRDEVCDFSEFVKELLAMPTVVYFKDKALEAISSDPCVLGTEYTSIWLHEEKLRFLDNMRDYLESRVDGAKDCPEASGLWAGTLADYIARRNGSIFGYDFNDDSAESFVAAANNAARREWVERRTGKTSKPAIPAPPRPRKEKKRGKPGRKKSEVKTEQVAEGVKWLKRNQGKNPGDAAKYVLETLRLAKPRWKEGGYEGDSATSSLAQAIRRLVASR
jgi:hypothetical protein